MIHGAPGILKVEMGTPEGLKYSPHGEGQNHTPLDGGKWLRRLVSGNCRKPALQTSWETPGL